MAGERIDSTAALADGMSLRLGSEAIRFEIVVEQSADEDSHRSLIAARRLLCPLYPNG